MTKKGILLCGHGTRLKTGVESFLKFAETFQAQLDGYETSAAFLELSEPDFNTGVETLVNKGVEEIIAVPLFLFTGVHIQKDIPCMLYQAGKQHNIPIKMANYIGVCNEMVDISEHLIKQAVPNDIIENPNDTALIIAGVGSSKPQANIDHNTLMRMIQERLKFPFSTVGFLSRMTFPSIEEMIENVNFLPYKNIVVLPYFFFEGVYVKRLEKAIKKASKKQPDKQFITTDLLASQQTLFSLLKKRMQDVIDGKVDVISQIDQETLEHYHGHGHHHNHGHHHDHHHHH